MGAVDESTPRRMLTVRCVASCDVVTPVGPTGRGDLSGGVLEPPTLELAETDGITYTADPEGAVWDVTRW